MMYEWTDGLHPESDKVNRIRNASLLEQIIVVALAIVIAYILVKLVQGFILKCLIPLIVLVILGAGVFYFYKLLTNQ
jgi:Na+/glutamate symporter